MGSLLMTVEAPTDGNVFMAYLEDVLCPQLKPGNVVVMDNLSAHKFDGVRQLVDSTGARVLYLPPYSPDFNPIEQCWAQVKQQLRAAKARSVATLEIAVATALQALLPCRRLFSPLRLLDMTLYTIAEDAISY